ncbi:MAG TPA: galactokinase [Polyangiaceae bacterium]|nr:galactokinase [Polyangiaceae bacterium]
MIADAGVWFSRWFGSPPSVFADAPGRVNLIGEHTDYSGGFVLPVALPLRTRVELAPREGAVVRVVSENVEGELQSYVLGDELRASTWADYVQGVTFALRAAGTEISGFDALIHSRVPIGSGLSSSAALEVALLRALRQAFELPLDDVAIARVGQRAENDFVGVPSGIMDQMAASLLRDGAALFLDTRSLEYRMIPMPESAELCVIDSGVRHAHASGAYELRHRECEEAARSLGVRQLRDALGRIDDVRALPPPLDRRARHVLSENERVLAAVRSLEASDLPALGGLLVASHRSLSRDFQVSTVEMDALVEHALDQPGVYGARMTGGGFGGSVLVLCDRGRAREVGRRVVGRSPGATVVACVPGASAS